MTLQKFLCLFGIYVIAPFIVNAQFRPDCKIIDGPSGLPHPNITQIVQGPKGFMWFATGNGIVRYDGHDFLSFRITDKEPTLSSNHITSLHIDHYNQLWIGSENGVDIMDLETYKIRNINMRVKGTQVPPADKFVYSFLESSNGTIWISTRTGQLYKAVNNTEVVRVLPLQKDVVFPNAILEEDTSDGTLWIQTTPYSVAKFDTATGKISAEFDFGKSNCYTICNSPKFGFVVSTRHGLYTYNRNLRRFEQSTIKLPGFKAYNIFNDHKNNLWISRGSDFLYRYTQTALEDFSSIFSRFPADAYNINCMYEDSLHNLWVGTTRGIVCFHIPDNRFKHYLTDYTKPNSIRSITQASDGMFYVGGYNLFVRINPATGKLTHPLTDTFTNYCLLPDTPSHLWFISEGRGVRLYNTHSNKVQSFTPWKLAQKWSSYLVSGYKDTDGIMWLGDYENLLVFNPRTQVVSRYNETFNGINMSGIRALHFYRTRDGHLWIASNRGLFELNHKRKPIRHYSEKAADHYRLSNNYVMNLHEDSSGILWIASSYGLNRLDRKTGRINHYTTENGLADNIVVSILEDSHRRLWIATNNGLSMFDIGSGQFRNYHTEDGLSHNEFNHGAFYKDKNGLIYFGGMNGINFFDPDKIENEYHVVPLLLSRIDIVNANSIYLFEVSKPYTLHLPYNSRSCQIQFALADYIRPEKNVYAYKLEGIDQEWTSLGHQSYIRFTSLAPGSYTLLIKAAGSNGVWTPKQLKLFIEVDQMIYKKGWFIALEVVVLLSIAWLIFHLRLQQIKRLSQMRIDIASDLHDEVGSALTRVAMQAELLAYDANNEQATMLHSIIESCRTAMSNMRDVIWSIDARNDSVADLIDRMNGHIRHMTEGSRFTYTFQYDPPISNNKINPNERQNIYLIFKEAINNIIKHSNGNLINVVFHLSEQTLELSITDNGIFTGYAENGGMGLANMKMRAQKINARFVIETENSFKVKLSKNTK